MTHVVIQMREVSRVRHGGVEALREISQFLLVWTAYSSHQSSIREKGQIYKYVYVQHVQDRKRHWPHNSLRSRGRSSLSLHNSRCNHLPMSIKMTVKSHNPVRKRKEDRMGPGGCTDQMLASQTEFKGVAVGSHILLGIGTFGLPLDQG